MRGGGGSSKTSILGYQWKLIAPHPWIYEGLGGRFDPTWAALSLGAGDPRSE